MRLLMDADYSQQFDMIVDELTDDYVRGAVGDDDRNQIERYFLRSADRRQQLKFATALKKRVSESDRPHAVKGKSNRKFFRSSLPIAASILILVGLSIGIWLAFSRQSEVDKGLSELNAAYRQQRLIESRISGFNYAPYLVTRGNEAARVDQNALHRAELTLLTALKEKPTPTVHHALGEVFLAQRRYDEAIKEFEDALASEPNNARFNSDLGAAWLEKGKFDLERTGSNSADLSTGKGFEELGRSLEYLNKALQLDNNLLEALFNRALCQQYLLSSQAEKDWQEYLRRDPSSAWSEEARRNLKQLEEKRGRSGRNSVDALKQFQQARVSGDEDAAWKLLSPYYTTAGNELTNRLLDSLVETDDLVKGSDHDAAIADLSYVAQLELVRSRDRYTSDLVRQYTRIPSQARPVMADARRHMKAAYALFTQSKFVEAVNEYNHARLDYEKTGDSVELRFVDFRLAHCYIFLPDLERARIAFQHLISACEKNQYRWLKAQSLYGLAHVSMNNSEYSMAIDYSGGALATFQQSGDINGVLKCFTQLADINHSLHRTANSLGYLKTALSLAVDEQAEPMQKWGVLVQLGFSMTAKELSAAALLYQKEALDLAKQMDRPLIVSRSHGYLGSAYAAMQRYGEAVEQATMAYETGKNIAAGSGGLEIMANALLQLGDINREAGDCNKAVANYDRSIDLYKRLEFDFYNYAAHKGKLLCFAANSDDRMTGEELQTVLSLSEQYRSKITTENQRNSFFDMEQTVYDLAINYETERKMDPVAAFAYSEESRARSLLDALRRGCDVSKKGDGPEVNLPGGAAPMSLPEVQKMMSGRAQILQYSVLDDKVLMWVVTKSDIHHKEVAIGNRLLNDKVRAYLAALNRSATSNSDESVASGEELYRILVAPAEPFLDKSKFLCVVPDKILHYLPFGGLVSSNTSRYLAEDYEIGGAPSSTIFCYLSVLAEHKGRKIDERILSVGNPSFNHARFESLSDLPSAATEAQAIAELYPSRRVLLKDDAKENTVKSELKRASVVHFAMHYVLDENSAMLSGFPLSADGSSSDDRINSEGFLQSYEIYGMKLTRTRLVVLSACQTGIDQEYRGEGVVSIARPFLIAGVPSVVATLWPVDSVATAELMASFHKHRVRDALPVTEALRKAQMDMAHGPNISYRHPYYWAAFVAIGGLSPY